MSGVSDKRCGELHAALQLGDPILRFMGASPEEIADVQARMGRKRM